MEYDVKGQPLVFSPKQWHGSCPWTGDRRVITVFVSRGWDHVTASEVEELKQLGFPVPKQTKQAAYPAEVVERERRKEDERIRKRLYLLHCATGHSPPKHMVQALKRRGVDERTLKLAEEFTCNVCKEKQRPPPRNLAALEPLPPKLYTIGADIGHWTHPHTEESYQFMIIVDEGSRFRTARILSSGSKKAPNAQDCLSYLQEGWVQYFGHPRALRLDPAGAFRSAAARTRWRAGPEQLRRAPSREELVEALATKVDTATPWTFQAVANQIGGNRFEDISSEVPPEAEWHRAQQSEEEAQPIRQRLRGKRPPRGQLTPDTVIAEPDEPEPTGGEFDERARSRSRGRPPQGVASQVDQPAAWWTTVADHKWPEEEANYWSNSDAAVEVEISFPQSQRGRQRALRDLSGYFVGSLRRRAVELSERRMTTEEKEAFQGAKAIEVKNFVASRAFEVLPSHLRPDKSQAIGMRWILTWKLKEDGSRKPKARAVLLGYQDEGYEHRATTSPVMTRTTRQILLQLSAWKHWRVQKGDVTGAFLQSRQYPEQLYCIPCPEICESLGIPAGSVTRVKRACYGLVDAPLEWYRDGDRLWESKLKAIQDQFKWGDWEKDKFTQCGVMRSTVETIIKANILLATAKKKQDHVMKVHSFNPEDTLTLVAWVDAAQGNRVDGGSTQGILIGMSTTKLLAGEVEGVSPISWTSQKIDRSCRSPGASESQAVVNGEDSLYAARFQWSELLYGRPDLHRPDDHVRLTGGCVVTDSRNVYDKLETEVLVVKGAEKRTSIELLTVKESQENTAVGLRWVHSEAQLANSLTKAGGYREYELYYKMGHRWCLVEDEAMMSAKRRKDLGLQPLESTTSASENLKGLFSNLPCE
eukprot:s2629_g4.t1